MNQQSDLREVIIAVNAWRAVHVIRERMTKVCDIFDAVKNYNN